MWLQSQIKEGDEPAVEEQTLKMAAAAVLDLGLFKGKVREIEVLSENGLIGTS